MNYLKLKMDPEEYNTLSSLDSFVIECEEDIKDYNSLSPEERDNILTLKVSREVNLPFNFLFPSNLTTLDIYEYQFPLLPRLPDSILYLYCYKSKINSLPNLPPNLIFMSCNSLLLFSLPFDYILRLQDFVFHPDITFNFFFMPYDIPNYGLMKNTNHLPLLKRLQRNIRERIQKRKVKVLLPRLGTDLSRLVSKFL